MAYIGQGIKEGTFSVLDTSGNTYNGSNVTFSLGTQVGSPAQLLVSHDGVIQKPGTDYTLATGGTQITFTTAPASGASIFITEISGAVGGPLDSDLNGTELILDADGDTSITADTDDQIDIKVAGTDQITIKDGAVSPVTDNDVDLGTTSLEFKDGYFDGTLHCDVLDLAGTEHTSITGFSVSSITGATALGAEPATTDEFVLSDAGTLKRVDYSHIRSGMSLLAKAEFGSATGSSNIDIQDFVTSSFKKYRIYMNFSDTSDNIDAHFRFLDGSNNTIDSGYYVYAFGHKNNGSSSSDEGWLDSNTDNPRLFDNIDAGDKMVATGEYTFFPKGQGNGHQNVLMGTYGFVQQADYLVQGSIYARCTNTTNAAGIRFFLSSGSWNKVDFEVYGLRV
jgi:hypothetical protein